MLKCDPSYYSHLFTSVHDPSQIGVTWKQQGFTERVIVQSVVDHYCRSITGQSRAGRGANSWTTGAPSGNHHPPHGWSSRRVLWWNYKEVYKVSFFPDWISLAQWTMLPASTSGQMKLSISINQNSFLWSNLKTGSWKGQSWQEAKELGFEKPLLCFKL